MLAWPWPAVPEASFAHTLVHRPHEAAAEGRATGSWEPHRRSQTAQRFLVAPSPDLKVAVDTVAVAAETEVVAAAVDTVAEAVAEAVVVVVEMLPPVEQRAHLEPHSSSASEQPTHRSGRSRLPWVLVADMTET